jgi:putative addiction module component (TIGR02574 family)
MTLRNMAAKACDCKGQNAIAVSPAPTFDSICSIQHHERSSPMTTVDVVALPVAEKLKLMETLWDSLCIQSGANMDLPAWHAEVLEQRLRRLTSDEESVAPWNEAKERIRARIKSH